MITDLRARQIASEWHGGMWTPLYSLASTGAINPDHARITTAQEIADCIGGYPQSPQETTDLELLLDYVAAHGTRGPVDGWADLRW